MKNLSNPTLLERIQMHQEALPGSERRIADLLLEFPGDLLAFQSVEIAERAGSSKAAFSRLLKRLGYSNFRELQKEVRRSQMAGIPFYRVSSMSVISASGQWAQSHLDADISCLRRTYELLDQDAFKASVNAAVKAHRIWTLGFRNSYFFAEYLKRQLLQFRPNVSQIPAAGQSIMDDVANGTANDLVIAVGIRRRSRDFHTYLKTFREIGIPILYITDHQNVRSTQHATWVLRCHTAGIDQLDTYTGLVSLLGMFATQFTAKVAKEGRSYNENVEKWVGYANETDALY